MIKYRHAIGHDGSPVDVNSLNEETRRKKAPYIGCHRMETFVQCGRVAGRLPDMVLQRWRLMMSLAMTSCVAEKSGDRKRRHLGPVIPHNGVAGSFFRYLGITRVVPRLAKNPVSRQRTIAVIVAVLLTAWPALLIVPVG